MQQASNRRQILETLHNDVEAMKQFQFSIYTQAQVNSQCTGRNSILHLDFHTFDCDVCFLILLLAVGFVCEERIDPNEQVSKREKKKEEHFSKKYKIIIIMKMLLVVGWRCV